MYYMDDCIDFDPPTQYAITNILNEWFYLSREITQKFLPSNDLSILGVM